VEHAFGKSAPFSLGIEEEFQLVSAESYELGEIESVLERGTGADEQRRVYEESEGSLLAVGRWLVEETVRDVR
jgi:gamma-glutamyl:cysteine ligase YbdK (ATP-grasp superfamily)